MEFGVPLCVQSDKGGRNILLCQFMVSYKGLGRGSDTAGPSVHSQRIERLWRDVQVCVLFIPRSILFFRSSRCAGSRQ